MYGETWTPVVRPLCHWSVELVTLRTDAANVFS